MKIIPIPSSAKSLGQLSARELLAGPASATLDRLRKEAAEACDKLEDVWLQLEIEAVRCKSFNFDGLVPEKRNEVYVVGWMVDGAGQRNVYRTQIKPGVRKGDLIVFESNGQGVPVARLKNPKECVSWGFAVMEDDDGARELGAVIESTLGSGSVKNAISAISTAAGAAGNVVAAVQAAADLLGGVLVTALKNNKDDLMHSHEGGGLAIQFFNAHDPGEAENTESNYARARYAVHLYQE